MTQYSQKVIQNLKPQWYMNLSTKEKLAEQKTLKETHALFWKKKPDQITIGTELTAKESTNSITKGQIYSVKGHFCTLVSTIYSTQWRQFVTLKNDNGYTVKMNLTNFIAPELCTIKLPS